MTDDKIKFTQEDLDALRRRVRDHRDTNALTWDAFGGMIGIGGSTLSAFSAGQYRGDNQRVADEVAKWFRTGETQDLFGDTLITPSFQPTTTAKTIHQHLTYAKLGNMVTIIGSPGVGKTEAEKEFMAKNSNVWIVTGSPSKSNYNAFMGEVLKRMNVTAVGRSGYMLSDRIRTVLLSRHTPLLIIDEAQHLGERLLEEIRSWHDETKCGVAFCGNDEVTRTVDGTRTANFAQRSSRISKRLVLPGPSGFDVKLMLEAWGVTDDREFKFLEGIATRPGGGALRQMSKVLELATLMANGERKKRDFRYIIEAADQLNTGLAA